MSFPLAPKEPFSESVLWSLQRQYFEDKGIEAWQQGEVPHYVTSNPRIANSYAEMVFAMYRDAYDPAVPEPMHIVELGGGSGRFAFYLLSQLQRLCGQAGIPLSRFRYIISDFTQSNLAFWKVHPRLKPFFEEGILEMAMFDVLHPGPINLQSSGRRIEPGSLQQPMVVIANYLFDSVPQDLFYGSGNDLHACLATVSIEDDPMHLNAGDILKHMVVEVEHIKEPFGGYPETYLTELLSFYKGQMDDRYFFFPASDIRCLEYLRSFSGKGMMLLTADKGEHRVDGISYAAVPPIVTHGSFSLSVNYHAFELHCNVQGGLAMFNNYTHASINTGCLLFVPDVPAMKTVAIAYHKYVTEAGPDDYFGLFSFLREQAGQMTARAIFSCLRLSLFDSHQLQYYLPRLEELLPDMSIAEKNDLIAIIQESWASYYPLGERADLAHAIGQLLYDMNLYAEALHFFRQSAVIYGSDTGTLFNMAACYGELGDTSNCIALLQQVLTHDPGNEPAAELLQRYRGREKAWSPTKK